MWDMTDIYNQMVIDMSSVICFVFTLSFFTLICLLRKYVHYEYKRITKPLMIYFFVAVVAHFLVIIEFVILSPGVYINRKLVPNRDAKNEFDATPWAVVRLIFYICHMLSLPQIFLSISVILFKDNKDMISEISKLDNLYKVSIF